MLGAGAGTVYVVVVVVAACPVVDAEATGMVCVLDVPTLSSAANVA
jgi:hypothetical protein